MNMVLGISFTLYSDNTFFTLLPMYTRDLGFTQDNAANFITASTVSDLGSRIFLALLSLFVNIEARNIFLLGSVAIIFVRFSMFSIFFHHIIDV